MNPTDQARKEARKRELKKNKKQRQMVRTAVLKGKNPRDLIVDLEKIDDMEYNVLAPPPLNEIVAEVYPLPPLVLVALAPVPVVT